MCPRQVYDEGETCRIKTTIPVCDRMGWTVKMATRLSLKKHVQYFKMINVIRATQIAALDSYGKMTCLPWEAQWFCQGINNAPEPIGEPPHGKCSWITYITVYVNKFIKMSVLHGDDTQYDFVHVKHIHFLYV